MPNFTGRGDRPGGPGRKPYGDKPAGKKPYGERPAGDRPYNKKPYGERPEGDKPYGKKPYGERPAGDRPYNKKPYGERAEGDRPYNKKPYGDRAEGDKPYSKKPYGERPAGDRPYNKKPYGERAEGDRPYNKKPYGDRPYNKKPYGERAEGDRPYNKKPYGERPAGDRPYNKKPYGERAEGDRPYNKKPYGERSEGDRPYNKKPYGERAEGDRPYYKKPYGERAEGDRPYYKKPYGERSEGDRPYNKKPYGERAEGDRPYNKKPYGERAEGDRPYYKKPYGERAEGDRPYNKKPYGERSEGGRTYNNKPYNKKPYGERAEAEGQAQAPAEKGHVNRTYETRPRYIAPEAQETYEKRFYSDEVPEEEAALPLIVLGRNAVREAVKSGRSIDRILVLEEQDGSLKEILALAKERGIVVRVTDRRKLDELCMPFGHNGKPGNHQGIVAQVPDIEYAELSDLLEIAKERNEPPFLLLLDEINDPNNLGSMLRSAACAGMHGVVITKRRAASVTAAVAKASSGAVEYIKVARVGNLSAAIATLKEAGVWICGADAAGKPMTEVDLTGPVALVIGNEGEGLSRLVRESCDHLAAVPMRGPMDSLNASVAAAVLMFEKNRQDAAKKPPVEG